MQICLQKLDACTAQLRSLISNIVINIDLIIFVVADAVYCPFHYQYHYSLHLGVHIDGSVSDHQTLFFSTADLNLRVWRVRSSHFCILFAYSIQ